MSASDVCCWANCHSPAGSGTHTQIEVPQIAAAPMTVTLPVCEEHWFGNWHRECRELQATIDLLRQRLVAIAALASNARRPTP